MFRDHYYNIASMFGGGKKNSNRFDVSTRADGKIHLTFKSYRSTDRKLVLAGLKDEIAQLTVGKENVKVELVLILREAPNDAKSLFKLWIELLSNYAVTSIDLSRIAKAIKMNAFTMFKRNLVQNGFYNLGEFSSLWNSSLLLDLTKQFSIVTCNVKSLNITISDEIVDSVKYLKLLSSLSRKLTVTLLSHSISLAPNLSYNALLTAYLSLDDIQRDTLCTVLKNVKVSMDSTSRIHPCLFENEFDFTLFEFTLTRPVEKQLGSIFARDTKYDKTLTKATNLSLFKGADLMLKEFAHCSWGFYEHVFLICITGEIMKHPLDGSKNSRQFESSIYTQLGRTYDQSRFILNGRGIFPDTPLSNYHIQSGDRVFVVFRLRGG